MTTRWPGAADIAVVFVNYHSEHLIRPLALLYWNAGFSVLVADNSGTYPDDGPGKRVSTDGNIGFGGGCNRAVAALDDEAQVLCLHNPDVDPCVETIRAAAAVLQRQERPGLVAPAEAVKGLVRRNGYHYPSPARELALSATTYRREARSHVGTGSSKGRGRRFAGAGLLLCSRDAWEAVKGFDEDYFLYGEDLDLWHRVVASGFDCGFAPELSFRHHMGTGSPMSSRDREVLRWLGVELFAAKHSGVGWRPYRSAHRPFLGTVAGDSALAELLRVAWRQGLDPRSTLDRVRAALAPYDPTPVAP